MKTKALLISLALALMLMTLAPATALAAKPQTFHADGEIMYISPGEVLPAGESGRWRVIERELGGVLLSEVEGVPTSISGPFTMIYKANVELATQAGNFHGILKTGEYSFKVNGKTGLTPSFELTLSGHWNLAGSQQGQGKFYGWVAFEFDEQGHIIGIADSSFNMTGKW